VCVRRAEGSSAQQQQQFADFLLALGEGRIGPSIQLPAQIFISLEAGITELAGRAFGGHCVTVSFSAPCHFEPLEQ
jgi:hypothetical protein